MISDLRKYKIFGLAIFDLVVGMIGMVILMLIFWKIRFSNLNPIYFILAGILITIPVGILFHVIFGVNTALNKKLGLSN
jgi:hypothetical protein